MSCSQLIKVQSLEHKGKELPNLLGMGTFLVRITSIKYWRAWEMCISEFTNILPSLFIRYYESIIKFWPPCIFHHVDIEWVAPFLLESRMSWHTKLIFFFDPHMRTKNIGKSFELSVYWKVEEILFFTSNSNMTVQNMRLTALNVTRTWKITVFAMLRPDSLPMYI